jgi:small subunit ribosomal protein S21e
MVGFIHLFHSTETSQIIRSKDHASVQINIGLVDGNGRYTGQFKTVAFAGNIRSSGESDNAMNRYALKNKIMQDL